MKIGGPKQPLTLFLGDILLLILSLWLTLFARYGEAPTTELFRQHLVPFSFIFILWLTIFFIFDLYRKSNSLLRRQLPSLLLRVQAINALVAIIFFYYVPIFGITPRTTLFIYLIISFLFITVWHLLVRRESSSTRRVNVVFMCEGPEVEELKKELPFNPRYQVIIRSRQELPGLTPDQSLMIVFNPYTPLKEEGQPLFYQLLLKGVTFINVHDLYEEVFDRVPVSILDEQWLLEHISSRRNYAYDFFKRLLDIIIAVPLALISLVIYPVVILAIKLEDGGPVFITQERVGRGGKLIKIHKFRSMTGNDSGNYGENGSNLHVTKIGRLIRLTRVDELPQLWSVILGRLSLIGPRPELPSLVRHYEEVISYYNIRHLIKPGLSGWAQIYGEHAHHGTNVDQTKNKLSYDLFYIKNRQWWLDLSIALKTIRTIVSTKGI
ncbi:MAG: sugar transferase [Candidatus Pacebacteria bacterium]|nr:sugar transferase [Candidatus Paceibacterota bacterium]